MEKNIVIESDYLSEGLFGQVLTWLIEILPALIHYNIFPQFIIKTKNYGSPQDDYNIIPSILEYNYIPKKAILPEEWKNYVTREDEENVYVSFIQIKSNNKFFIPDFDIVNKHLAMFFKFNAYIMNRLNNVLPASMDDSLGIHYRGTDKITDNSQNSNQITDEAFFNYVDSIIKKRNIKKIYLATDSLKIYNNFHKRFSSFIIISLKIKRFDSNEWGCSFKVDDNQQENATNAIIDSLALSKCNIVISTNSALSAWSKIFNPELEIGRLNDFPQNWFPIHYIPKINI